MISIILSSANIGDQATETDFDAWAAYVAEHIDEALGIESHDGPVSRSATAAAARSSGSTVRWWAPG